MNTSKSKKKVYLVQGQEDSINTFFETLKILGNEKNIHIEKLENKECNVLADFTKDQIKILRYAKKYGYYDYPRRITSEELSNMIGINNDVTIEVLRKIEKSIISKILDEHSV